MSHILSSGNTSWDNNETPQRTLECSQNLEHYYQILVRLSGNRNFHSLLVEMQNGTITLAVSYKTNRVLNTRFGIVLHGIYLKKLGKRVHTKTCPLVLTAALFAAAETWKQ
jgi:hypothetical protein